jgi:hypothetical protein
MLWSSFLILERIILTCCFSHSSSSSRRSSAIFRLNSVNHLIEPITPINSLFVLFLMAFLIASSCGTACGTRCPTGVRQQGG